MSSQKKSNIRFTGRQWLKVALLGCLGYYVSSYLDFFGLQFVSAGMERLILFIYPTFVVLISALWFKEKVNWRQGLALMISYFGLVVAFISEVKIQTRGNVFFIGSLGILACAFTYAIYIVGSGKMIPSVGSVKFNSYAMSFASVGVLAHFFFNSEYSLFGLPGVVYGYAFFMAVISTVIPSYLVSVSLNRLRANNTAIIASIGPVSTILQAYYFLDEKVPALQWLGTIFIVVGILMISWKSQKTNVPMEG